ncbi:MAG TPA: DUF3050 domain-containing protein [Planctomycetaceae bacterium]|jgi:hypothetical protein|nr:DUF3050 domain-containing protein [Planctomycetaceae bacterium]
MTTSSLATIRERLLSHPVYAAVQTLPQLRLLMREHVFAVWDFMSLLKRVQQLVTGTTTPWLPNPDSESARFILEIVLGEEADEDGRGGYASHFELYRQAMLDVGADTAPIDAFLDRLRKGMDWQEAIERVDVLPSTRDFVRHTMTVVETGKQHEVAAAFFYGREDIIPEMFQRLVPLLEPQGVRVERMLHYLRRHIEVDGGSHGPLAKRLLARLCEGSPGADAEANVAAVAALQARMRLWDGILAAMQK